jgi:hypothetical protein
MKPAGSGWEAFHRLPAPDTGHGRNHERRWRQDYHAPVAGVIPLREAVIRLAEEQTPDAAVREYLKPPDARDDPFEDPNPPGPAWDALEDARRDLAVQLLRGDLIAWVVPLDGRLVQIPVKTWRTEVFAALRTGRIDGRDVLLPEVGKSLIPPLRVRLTALRALLMNKHGLTESEVDDVVVDLCRVPMRFRLAWSEDVFWSWDDLQVNWAPGRARDKRHLNGPALPLEVLRDAVTDAVTRLRMRQRRERQALPTPAPEPETHVDAPPPPIPPARSAPVSPVTPPRKPRLRYPELRQWWVAEYLPLHSEPDKRPSRKMQRADAAKRFRDHAPPSETTMQRLRAEKDTPGEWRGPGRTPE